MFDKINLGRETLTLSKENNEKPITLNYGKLKRAALTLRSLNHPLRKRLIEMIDKKKESIVTTLYKELDIEQSVVSQHLAILRRADILTTRRNGKFILYKVNKKRIKEVSDIIEQLV
jgi:DNA-binding transcriptional ArsR family regulator